ncbi:MAG: ascorbate-dependent monooxygenase [Bryobacteraceae bacterium]
MVSRSWLLALALASAASAEVTYNKDVSRIMQGKCVQCHRPNDIAPFSLATYEDASTWAEDIQRVVSERIMPPWKPSGDLSQFKDAYGLTDEERRTLLNWVADGAPQGEEADAPAAQPVSTSPWELGEPDLILAMPEFAPSPRVTDTYRCFVLPTGFTETKYVSAVQSLPGDRQITHHVLLFIDDKGEAEKLDGKDGKPGYTCFGGPGFDLSIGGLIGGWAPGTRTRRLPEDIAMPVPKNARIVMQVHYHPSGREGVDRTQVGFYFSNPDKVNRRLINIPLVNDTFKIPAGAENYEVQASQFVPALLSAKAITVAPHMHLLGRTIRVEVKDSNGEVRPMINIDNWDFNWQGFYTFTEPVALPANSTVRLVATYDNSANNPKNPNNPLVPVEWGERTTDEMALAFLGVVFDYEALLPFQKGAVTR